MGPSLSNKIATMRELLDNLKERTSEQCWASKSCCTRLDLMYLYRIRQLIIILVWPFFWKWEKANEGWRTQCLRFASLATALDGLIEMDPALSRWCAPLKTDQRFFQLALKSAKLSCSPDSTNGSNVQSIVEAILSES
jgi:hypothetical protein